MKHEVCPYCGDVMMFTNCPVTEGNGDTHCLGCEKYDAGRN